MKLPKLSMRGIFFAVILGIIVAFFVYQAQTRGWIPNSNLKPYLGIQYKFLSKMAASLNKVPSGAYIQNVVVSSPSDKVGIKLGDVITKINGLKVDNENVISDLVSKSNIGQTLDLTIIREGRESTVQVVLGESPDQ